MFIEDRVGCEIPQINDLWYWEDRDIEEATYLMLTRFKDFAKVVFHFIDIPELTKLQESFCDKLQYGSSRLVLMSYRGMGKSYLACIFVLWNLYRDPNSKNLIISVAEDKAVENSSFIKKLISSIDFLNYLDPKQSNFKSKVNKKSSDLAFDVAPSNNSVEQAPSVKAAGIGGRITGSRADNIIFDDIESIENSMSHKKREYILHKCVVEGESILKSELSRIIYLGTPQTFQSFYFNLQGFDVSIWPLRYPTKKQYDKYFINYLAESVKKELEDDETLFELGFGDQLNRTRIADPKRYTEKYACEKEFRMGPSNFDLQYMLYTHSADQDKYKLKFKDLIVEDLDLNKAAGFYTWTNANGNLLGDLPVNAIMSDAFYSPIAKSDSYFDYETTRMYIDVSGRGSDEMAYCVLKSLNGLIFIIETGGVANYDTENLKKLANVAKKYKVDYVKCEDNYGDGMFRSLFEPVLNKIYNTSLVGFKVGNQAGKEQRIIDILQPLFETHRLVVDRKCIIMDDIHLPDCSGNINKQVQYGLFYQIARLTNAKNCLGHDDRIDILASGCNDLVEFLDRDVNDENSRKSGVIDLFRLDEYENSLDFSWNE